MIKLDNDLLVDLGLGSLPASEKNDFLAFVYEVLERRVGMELASAMTTVQLDQFETLIDAGDESGALDWLQQNFPTYKRVVAAKMEELKGQISAVAGEILAASGVTPG